MLKRKVSCTFKRKNILEIKERIYPHDGFHDLGNGQRINGRADGLPGFVARAFTARGFF